MPHTLRRTVTTRWDADSVFAYLLDFEHAEEWDSGTVSCERLTGDGGIGTRYRNVSKFLGRETELDLLVADAHRLADASSTPSPPPDHEKAPSR